MSKILIVDDQVSIVKGLEQNFKMKHFDVKTASSAEEALALIDENAFDFLISDLKMPGISGLELVRRIKDNGGATNCILISAFFTLEDAIEAIRTGVKDLFCKPFDNRELVSRVEALKIQNTCSKLQVPLKRNMFVRSIGQSFHFFHSYRLPDLFFRFFVLDSNDCFIRLGITAGIPDFESGMFYSLVANSEEPLKELYEKITSSIPLLDKQGWLLFEWDCKTEMIEFYGTGELSVALLSDNGEGEINVSVCDGGKRNIPSNVLILFLMVSQKDQIVFSSDTRVPVGWVHYNEDFLNRLIKRTPTISCPTLGLYRPAFEPEFIYEFFPKDISPDCFLKSVREPLDAHAKDSFFIIMFLCVAAELFSNLRKAKYMERIFFRLSFSEEGIRLTAQGENIKQSGFPVFLESVLDDLPDDSTRGFLFEHLWDTVANKEECFDNIVVFEIKYKEYQKWK